MKKAALILMTIFAASIFLSSCTVKMPQEVKDEIGGKSSASTSLSVSSSSDSGLVTFSELRKTAAGDMEKVKNGIYGNIKIGNIVPNIPNVDEVYKIKLSRPEPKFKTVKAFRDYFKKIAAELLEKDNIDDQYIYFLDSNGERVYYKDAKDSVLGVNASNHMIVYTNTKDNQHMYMFDPICGLWVNKGKAMSFDKEYIAKGEIDGWSPHASFHTVKKYILTSGTADTSDEYNLLDGKVSVRDAVSYVEKYFNSGLPYETNKEIKTKIWRVDAMQINKNTYGYFMHMRREYGGLPFDYVNEGAYLSETKRDFDGRQALTIEKNKVDFFVGEENNRVATHEGGAITKILPLSEVFKALSKKLTQQTNFEVSSVELIYSENCTDVLNGPTEATPIWKIVAQNTKDTSYIGFYVDIQTGKVSSVSFSG